MSNKDHEEHIEVNSLVLGDGRRAERHVKVEANGDEIVEVFAEEARPLKLEERRVRKHKTIVSEERIEKVRDGEIIFTEVVSRDNEPPLQVRERIGLVDHAKVVDGDYVRKEEMSALISEAVVTGMSAMMERFEPAHEVHQYAEPIFKAQSTVADNVMEKGKTSGTLNAVLAGIVVVQVAFFAYLLVFVF